MQGLRSENDPKKLWPKSCSIVRNCQPQIIRWQICVRYLLSVQSQLQSRATTGVAKIRIAWMLTTAPMSFTTFSWLKRSRLRQGDGQARRLSLYAKSSYRLGGLQMNI